MFKKLAQDALGLSDIGKIIAPEDFGKTDADDYVMHEEEEKIFFLIKSKTDEYCFTDRALIHLDGSSAMSKKRMLYRHAYYKYEFGDVKLETAGTIDLDVELKFTLGQKKYSIDVDKNQIEQLKDLYKALLKIEEIQGENRANQEIAANSLDIAVRSLSGARLGETKLDEELKKLTDVSWNWLKGSRDKYRVKNFADVFSKFINN